MNKIKFLIVLFAILVSSVGLADDDTDSSYVDMPSKRKNTKTDKHNIIVQVGNIILLRSFSHGWTTDSTNVYSFIEAYDLENGQKLWVHKDVGYFPTFLVVNDNTIICRNSQKITALEISTGKIIWSQKTEGDYSIDKF